MLFAAAVLAACSHPEARGARSWNRRAAAAYLDRRADWWVEWPGAARDHGTVCVSCHTTLPYALARARLGGPPDSGASLVQRRVLDNVRARVRLWKDVEPYYANRSGDASKAAESRGTEAVLNALILADADARTGVLSDDARAAFGHMWALQETSGGASGAWPWLRFALEPWEGKDSKYYGAALAALAVGEAPDRYRSSPSIQHHLQLLREYLDREYGTQPLSNRLILLWASTTLRGLITPDRRSAIVDELLAEQRSDGGWSVFALAASTHSIGARLRSIISSESDGYATGLAVLALLDVDARRQRPAVRRAVEWLVRKQNTDGYWPASSMNARRDPSSDAGKFMSDAATAYAVLALTAADSRQVAHSAAAQKAGIAVEHLHVQRASGEQPRVAEERER